jgi:hypothetical protein
MEFCGILHIAFIPLWVYNKTIDRGIPEKRKGDLKDDKE